MMTPPMSRAPDDAAAIIPLPVNGAPEIPIWLAEARGCDPLPDTPPQDNSGAADEAAWLGSSQSGVGLGLSNAAYLFDGSWSMQPSQADYGVMMDHPFGQLSSTTLLYERARGSASAAIPPAMHAGGRGSDRRDYYNNRTSGVQLPYPQRLNDFSG